MIPLLHGLFAPSRPIVLTLVLLLAFSASAQAAERFQVHPPRVELDGNFSRVQLIVTGADDKGAFSDARSILRAR